MIGRAPTRNSAVAYLAICLATGLTGCDAGGPEPVARVEGVVRVAGTLLPIPGARLRLEREADARSTVADAAGAFFFDGVEAGTWRLTTEADSFRTSIQRITVRPGRHVVHPELVRIVDRPDEEETGFRLFGTIRSPGGHAIDGATVAVDGRLAARTDADGRFEVTWVGPDSVWVVASCVGCEGTALRLFVPPGGLRHDFVLTLLPYYIGIPLAAEARPSAPGLVDEVHLSWSISPEWTTVRLQVLRAGEDQAFAPVHDGLLDAGQTDWIDRAMPPGAWRYSMRVINLDGDQGTHLPFTSWVATWDLGLVPIPAGTFSMGSQMGLEDERPVHQVTISRSLWMGRSEMQNNVFRWIMTDGSIEPSWKAHGGLPVLDLRRTDYMDVLNRLGEVEGLEPCYAGGQPVAEFQTCSGYRLPTEAEWEYAARAGTSTDTFFGDDPALLDEYAWTAGNSEVFRPSGLKKPNPWGLYDVYGNAVERVEDGWSVDFYARSPAVDPLNPGSGVDDGVLRGGGIARHTHADPYRSTARMRPELPYRGIGLRIVRTRPD